MPASWVDLQRKTTMTNPIKMAISKLKSALRKLAVRTVAGLLAILEGCAGLFKPAECENDFAACGYDPAELPAFDTTRTDSALSRDLRGDHRVDGITVWLYGYVMSGISLLNDGMHHGLRALVNT
jgi:hypothetical protein